MLIFNERLWGLSIGRILAKSPGIYISNFCATYSVDASEIYKVSLVLPISRFDMSCAQAHWVGPGRVKPIHRVVPLDEL